MGTLYFGDNLNILREHIKDATVDLIYLDPPFNSKRDYNLLFKTPKGQASDAQITAFEDTWHWGEQAEEEFAELLHQPNTDVSEMIQSLRRFLKESDMMAYLTMMANRLLELYRVLKPTGSLYLHCDPTASHYLKVVLDAVFGTQYFKNELTWKRSDAHNDAKNQFGMISDRILFYGKSKETFFVPQYGGFQDQTLKDWYLYLEFPDGTIRRMTKLERESQIIPDGARRFNTSDLRSPNPRPNLMYDYKGYKPHKNGWAVSYEKMEDLDRRGLLFFPSTIDGRIMRKRYLDEQKGAVLGDIWTDISQLRGADAELLGYPTQKPLALLERIIRASSNEGDVVLDPFCGCGTAVHAAQKLGRNWIGIDITHLAISLIEKRMKDAFPGIVFEVQGTPKDFDSARDLALRDKYQFQWWACTLVNAQPFQGKKKGADTGIDGLIYFQDEAKDVKKIIVSVKGGEHVTRAMVADLKNSVEREKAQMGFFVTLTPPTQPMITEATSAGYYESPWYGAFPKIQILTIEGLLSGLEKPRYPDPSRGALSFKKAKVEEKKGVQGKLEI